MDIHATQRRVGAMTVTQRLCWVAVVDELTLFLANLRALLSLCTFSSSMILLSYGARPHTSFTTSRTNFTLLQRN